MRGQTREFVSAFLRKEYPAPLKVLDVGSMDVSGAIKDLFPNSDYTGLDMREGDNVTVVMDAHDMTYRNEFDVVCCFDTLEHDDKFWITVEKLREAVKPGGWLIIGVPGRNCPKHDHPSDYWRFMEDGVKTFFDTFEEVVVEAEADDEVYAKGRKPV